MKQEAVSGYATVVGDKKGGKVVIVAGTMEKLEKAFHRYTYGFHNFDPSSVHKVNVVKTAKAGVV